MSRQYAGAIGRFTSPDPWPPDAGDPQSFTRYAYVENDPINFIDPLGLMTCYLDGLETDCRIVHILYTAGNFDPLRSYFVNANGIQSHPMRIEQPIPGVNGEPDSEATTETWLWPDAEWLYVFLPPPMIDRWSPEAKIGPTISDEGESSRVKECAIVGDTAFFNTIMPGLGDVLNNGRNVDIPQKLVTGIIPKAAGTVAGVEASAATKSSQFLWNLRSVFGIPMNTARTYIPAAGLILTIRNLKQARNAETDARDACMISRR